MFTQGTNSNSGQQIQPLPQFPFALLLQQLEQRQNHASTQAPFSNATHQMLKQFPQSNHLHGLQQRQMQNTEEIKRNISEQDLQFYKSTVPFQCSTNLCSTLSSESQLSYLPSNFNGDLNQNIIHNNNYNIQMQAPQYKNQQIWEMNSHTQGTQNMHASGIQSSGVSQGMQLVQNPYVGQLEQNNLNMPFQMQHPDPIFQESQSNQPKNHLKQPIDNWNQFCLPAFPQSAPHPILAEQQVFQNNLINQTFQLQVYNYKSDGGFLDQEQIVSSQLISKALALQRQVDGLCTCENQVLVWNKSKKAISKSQRGSLFRGVSKNGKKWQVQLLGSLRTRYIGSIANEATAAQIYDFFSILQHGLKAKTNFTYTKNDIIKVVQKALLVQGLNKEELLMLITSQ